MSKKKHIINRKNKIKEDYKANLGEKFKNIKEFTIEWEWYKKKHKNFFLIKVSYKYYFKSNIIKVIFVILNKFHLHFITL